MNHIEAQLLVALDEQGQLFVFLKAGIVLTAAAFDLHLLAFTAQANIMLTLWMCGGKRILQQFTLDIKKKLSIYLFVNVYCVIVNEQRWKNSNI